MSVLDTPVIPAPRPSGGPGGEGLVSVFVRLKLTLLRNGLRQSSGRLAAYISSVVVTLLIAASTRSSR